MFVLRTGFACRAGPGLLRFGATWARRFGLDARKGVLRAEVDGPMAKFNPFHFAQEVRQETAKVTWPSRRETWVTTVAVVIMVALSSIFFLLVDQALGFAISSVLQAWR